MRNKLFMRITALLLAVVFVFLLPVRVYALSGVIGGIAGGLGLTMGELAGLILAGAGVVVGTLTLQEYGDDLQRALNQAMQAEQAKFYTDPAMQAQVAEELEAWKAKAQAGYIELESGVAWVVDAVKDWAVGFFQGDVVYSPSYNSFGTPNYSLGAVLPAGTAYRNNHVYSLTLSSDAYVCSWFAVSQTVYDKGVCQEDITLTTYLVTSTPGTTFQNSLGNSGSLSSSVTIDSVTYYYCTLTGQHRTISSYKKTDLYDTVHSFLPGRYIYSAPFDVANFIRGCLAHTLTGTDVNVADDRSFHSTAVQYR